MAHGFNPHKTGNPVLDNPGWVSGIFTVLVAVGFVFLVVGSADHGGGAHGAASGSAHAPAASSGAAQAPAGAPSAGAPAAPH